MSAEASAWALGKCEMNSGMKLMLLVLANHADGSGVTFIGRQRVAEEACCTPGTVTANLRRLEDEGYIRRFERRRQNGSRTSDWTVLAPGAADRGPMKDALRSDSYAFKDEIADAAQRVTPDISGEDEQPSPVQIPKGPEQSVEQSEDHPASASARDELDDDAEALLKRKTKVGSRIVGYEEMAIAVAVVRAFNAAAGTGYGLGAHLMSIVGRARERPSWDVATHVRLVESAFRLRWWERDGRKARGRLKPNVIYGNERVFEQVIQDAADEKAGKISPGSGGRFTKKSKPGSEEF